MDFIRRWLTQIQVQLGQLSFSLKLAIGCMVALLGAIIFVVALYASQPEMVPLLDQATPPADRAAITADLRSRNINFQIRNDRIMVPAERQMEALAALQLRQLLPKDTTEGFRALIVDRMSWWQTSDQQKQLELVAKQEVLKQVIQQMRDVQDATVIIALPQEQGFGATRERPTASANLVMVGGTKVNQKLVDAVAGLISGSIAEMTPEDVTVIDAIAGRSWRVRTDDAMTADSYLESLRAQEHLYQEKISSLLSYIPKVIVAVHVELDMTDRQRESQVFDNDSSVSLITASMTTSESTVTREKSGEPGARPNTEADIRGSDGVGTTSNSETTEETFEPHAGSEVVRERTPRGLPERISASINVPRSYFVSLYMQGKPEDTPEPTDAVLQPLAAEHLDRIKNQVAPMLATGSPGDVVVDMYHDTAPALAAGTALAGAGGGAGGTIGAVLSHGMSKYIALGGLAVVAVGMMLLMMRRAAAPQKMPSPAELAGIPPSLPNEDDVIGEAEEMDTALTGVELDDNQIRSRKLAEQVKDLVKSNPNEASTLVQRWVRRAD